MRNLIWVFVIAISSVAFSCKKVDRDAIVIKDCTGSYLRMNGKDYKICNDELVQPFKSGTEVTATFKKIKKCEDSDNTPICALYHAYESYIKIDKIE